MAFFKPQGRRKTVSIRDQISIGAMMLFAPFRALFRATLPLTLCPRDTNCGVVEEKTIDQLADSFKGKKVLCVGGTKGIGKATADVIREAGGKVTVVGRTATPPTGIAADLATVSGCKELTAALKEERTTFDYVIFSIGVWPSATDAYTADGIHKVFAIDLLSRHMVLRALIEHQLLSEDVRIMSILASSQNLPASIVDKPSLMQRLSDSTRPEGVTGLRAGFHLMLCTAIANDAWLHAMAPSLPPGAHVMGTFPGLLVTDLAASTFPAWLLPLVKLAQTPLSDSDEECGLRHASILASPNVGRKRVSFWAAPRLEAYEEHPLARDAEVRASVHAELERLTKL